MFKAGVIALIIIFLQVTTFACDWKAISPSFFKALNAQSNVFQLCQTLQDNAAEKIATIGCINDKTYMVFYSKNSVYMQTSTNTRNHILTRCWREGTVNASCEATVDPIKCQSWDLDTY